MNAKDWFSILLQALQFLCIGILSKVFKCSAYVFFIFLFSLTMWTFRCFFQEAQIVIYNVLRILVFKYVIVS